MTGIGGFLQEFLYGYSGMRWNADSVAAEPEPDAARSAGSSCTTCSGAGRTFTGRDRPAAHDGHADQPARRCRSRRPRGPRSCPRPGADAAHPPARPGPLERSGPMRPVTASSAQPGAPALAAVDGSPATDWEPASVRLDADRAARAAGLAIRTITLRWGRSGRPRRRRTCRRRRARSRCCGPRATRCRSRTTGAAWRKVAAVSGQDRPGARHAASATRARASSGSRLTATSATSSRSSTELTIKW